ncbi:MAG: hypothetical protein JWP74_1699 [Marmoricola sp.]|nr:hypothetical protein [Marmoricola sp.]
MVDEPGVWFGIATGCIVAALLVTAAAGLGTTGTACTAVLVAGLVASRLRGPVVAALGVIAWAFFTGFDENRFGQLTFHDPDLVRLTVFALATVLIAGVIRTRTEHSRG